MSSDRIFDHAVFPQELAEHLGISSGEYSGKYDTTEGKLILTKIKGHDKGTVVTTSISLPQLLLIVMQLERDRGDKFTEEEKAIIQKMKRSRGFSGTRTIPHHHIIPLQVCQHSKLVNQAINLNVFKGVNDDRNKRPLSVNFHPNNHAKYSDKVETMLEKEWTYLCNVGLENAPDVVEDRLILMIEFLNKVIDDMIASGVASINDIWDL